MKTKQDKFQVVTDHLINLMETQGKDWIKPFAGRAGGMPVNAVTGNRYNGINIAMCMMFSTDTEFASYKQWKSIGAQVKKGSKGIPIMFFNMIEKEDKNTGEASRFPMARWSTVFGASQVEGYEPEVIDRPVNTVENVAAVDAYITKTGAKISHNDGGRAFYSPAEDSITMPNPEWFSATDTSDSTVNYYSTLLHELTHWTGHKSRLDRLDTKNREGYAFEELIAEIGAAYQCCSLGITTEPREDHAKYLNGWLTALKSDKKYFFKAAAKAQKAIDHIEGLQVEQSQAA